MIPRRLHHIWLSDQPESHLAQHCVSTWWRMGCEVTQVGLDSPECADPIVAHLIGHGKIGRVKANDYLRVKLLLDHGGWYMDNDVEVLKSFSSMEAGCVFAAESDTQVNFAVLGAEPSHWFLAEVLEQMRRRIDEPDPVKFSLGTATDIARRHSWSGNREFSKDGLRILASETFFPHAWNEPYSPAKITPETLAVHYWGHSWGGPLVSVVIPCYKQAQYLAESIESALAQSWGHKEIIVVDDGSPDNAADIARRYPVRLISQPNRGLPAARNAGIREARGEWVMCLDADDRMAPKCIERCMSQKGDIICPGQQEFEGGQRFYRRAGGKFDLRAFLAANRIHCASLFRKTDWERAGGYDESMTLGLEDWEFWIRLVAAGAKVAPVDEPLFFYRVHQSMTAQTTKPRFSEIVAYMKEKHAAMHGATCSA